MSHDGISKTDLKRIEDSLKKVLKASKNTELEEQYIDMLKQVTEAISDLRLTVEFDHERRLQAIEEFLQEL